MLLYGNMLDNSILCHHQCIQPDKIKNSGISDDKWLENLALVGMQTDIFYRIGKKPKKENYLNMYIYYEKNWGWLNHPLTIKIQKINIAQAITTLCFDRSSESWPSKGNVSLLFCSIIYYHFKENILNIQISL